MSTEFEPQSQLPFETLAAPAGGVPLAAAVSPKTDRSWGAEIIGAVDDIDLLLDMTESFVKRKSPAGFHKLLQTNQSATQIAEFMLSKGVTSLISDNDMHGVLGLNVIREIARLGDERAKNIAFVLFTGYADAIDVIEAVGALNKELSTKGCKQVLLLKKPCNTDLFYPTIESSWRS